MLSTRSHENILSWGFWSQHGAIIDCARAEVALFCFFESVVLDPSTTKTAKLTIVSDTPDATVSFTPSHLFLLHKALPLPLLILTTATGLSAIFVRNPFTHTVLRGGGNH